MSRAFILSPTYPFENRNSFLILPSCSTSSCPPPHPNDLLLCLHPRSLYRISSHTLNRRIIMTLHPHTPTYAHIRPHTPTYAHIHPHTPTYAHIHPHTLTYAHIRSNTDRTSYWPPPHQWRPQHKINTSNSSSSYSGMSVWGLPSRQEKVAPWGLE